MTARSRPPLLLAALLAALVLLPATASAAPPHPAWKLGLLPLPASLQAGQKGELQLHITNVGGDVTDGTPVDVQIALPEQLEVVEAVGHAAENSAGEAPQCTTAVQVVSCETDQLIVPSDSFFVQVPFKLALATPEGPLALGASVAGGGGAGEATSSKLSVSPNPLFGFRGPLTAPLTNPDGSPAATAGAHPGQYTVAFDFPTVRFGPSGNEFAKVTDPAREIITHLPPGLIADPAATPVLCTEAEFASNDATGRAGGCPPGSQVGLITIITPVTGAEGIGPITSALYDMVPPPGAPAELAFNAAGVGIETHLIGGVRSDGDYSLYTEVEAPALQSHALIGVEAQIWGDPSSHAFDFTRGEPRFTGGGTGCHGLFTPCEVPDQPIAFLTTPGHCPGAPDTTTVSASTWGAPETFTKATYESADLEGNPVSTSGCNALEFTPTLSAQPTTNLADSPSGLDVDLHQPTDLHKEHLAPAELRDASVTLPAGISVNPSQADGLAACSLQQIGYLAEDPEPGIHFSKAPNTCPDASKLGTVEVTTPLLPQRNEANALITDPETGDALPEPLRGAVYIAEPFHNPFDSLLAIYLAVEDPKSGTVAKLAGQVEPDPATGQLTTVFKENPQLPLEDVRLHLFGGARGSLITPLTCGAHTTTADLVPWSSPEGADAHPQSAFQITAEPGGGSCPTSEPTALDAPSFTAGTLTPQAGAYSPFVLKLSREDGSQRLTGIDTLLPPGLTGKLAGIAACSDSQIAQAEARRNPEEGRLEREGPSCPGASEVGTVTVGAGAGPTPFYTQGHAYLAGPYKGAPLSLAVIVPAIAGPFDLGTVVTRVALHVEPETAQIHAVSDPLPTILDGIPLDVRSIALKMDRPEFTLNPTSCNPMAITGLATSSLGSAASLSSPFQVGGCQALPFRPKLSLRLKGSVRRSSNPRLIATLRARPGEANVGRAQVKLPHPVFLDQAHIRTICTRIQWTADACPAGSVYGKAEATTPLLSYPLTGSVYLRSSAHPLPDLVAKLQGPTSQPIEIDLDGKTDSVKAALRNTFEAVPDAPVSSFRLELFGGKRSLVEMSDGFCRHRRATVSLTAQSGKVYETTPVVAAKCPKRKKGKSGGGKHHHKRS